MQPKSLPNLTAVVAMDQNRGIGKNNQLLWHLPADLAHFKYLTLNHAILMGRRTFISIGKPLPKRQNIVLTHDQTFNVPDVLALHSIESVLNFAKTLSQPLMIIGGAEIYQAFMPYLNRIDLTLVEHTFAADTFFPELDAAAWREVHRENHTPDEKNKYAYSFVTLERI